INPDFGTPELRTHYDNIKQMVKEKTGRAMQEKERERKGKNGKIIKVAGCSPIREGVLLIRPDTTLADVRKFGEECQRRWGITPLQIFLHKDEGHWLNGQPEAEDRESFKVGNRWFKPNYHAHIVFDWMNHETGKSRKLNDEDMAAMQTLASNILLMERGQAKAVTGKEHLERNDFIIKKQKAELQRIEETKRHKEQQVSLAEQELKQVKAEIRTDKLKSAATDVATAITSGVGSLFGSGKLKDLEQSNENLRHEIAKRDKGIDELKAKMQQMQEQHSKQIRNLQGIHNQELEAKDKEISRLNAILEKAFNWFPLLKEMLRMEKLCYAIGFTKDMINSLLTKKEAIRCNGRIYSEEHKRKFDIKNDIFKVEKNPTDDSKLILTINRQPIGEWFKEQWEKLRQGLRQLAEEPRKSRGFRM
ncbi:coiled-coil domain-containing protein, partial [Bacteroides uniformis]